MFSAATSRYRDPEGPVRTSFFFFFFFLQVREEKQTNEGRVREVKKSGRLKG